MTPRRKASPVGEEEPERKEPCIPPGSDLPPEPPIPPGSPHPPSIPPALVGIDVVEASAGPLSPLQRVLLSTDGSVTRLLEAITGEAVAVRTCVQEFTPAGSGICADLSVAEAEVVNYRVVDLVNARSGEVLIHATSQTPVNRLPEGAREDLLRADIPIGTILARHRIEARREILGYTVLSAGDAHTTAFPLLPAEPVLSRTYRVIHNGAPLMRIEERFPYHSFRGERGVLVGSAARLHIGLIDMHGGLGRVDGGIGLALNEPSLLLEVYEGGKESAGEDASLWSPEVTGGDPWSRDVVERAAKAAGAVFHPPLPLRFRIRETVPTHCGLGSGTQLALATAAATARFAGKDEDAATFATLTGRGGTSGIGTAVFRGGGFILDGGHRFGPGREKETFLPSRASRGVRPAVPVLCHPFPGDWQVLLTVPTLPEGFSGEREKDFFRANCPVPAGEVSEICRRILVQVLPGVVEHDLDLFSEGINALQDLGFKRAEIACRPPSVPAFLSYLRESGASCSGMSSFGPAVYAIGDTGMRDVESAAREWMDEHGGGRLWLTTARNTGAAVRDC